ncbi:DUF975 family protein [Streptococcus loxodontisalivarius]|uniref:Membrane protein n=1 Tax=Streptococcus loxodontisalivarius TaxID=1349415 RepID=A0ABS2PU23_9STRE|nr:DUF975 family protein [Streptococcus loxodontisalivarius]MBM7642979.1 putative membrane protein [Streptococcus loxodontisalivarius]
MERRALKQAAKEKLVGNWLWGVGISLITLLVSLFISFISSGLGGILNGILSAGIILAMLHLIDNRKDDNIFSAAFSGFTENRILPVFLTSLLQYIFIGLWSLLLVVPGIIKSYSYAMSLYIVDDLKRQGREVKPTEAITKSRRLMDGHKMELFIFDLSFIGWFILGSLAFGIGTLWVGVYYYAAKAEFYRELANQNPSIIEEEY